MKITLENYEEVKKELAKFEAEEKYRLEQIAEEERIKELKRKFLNSLPKNCGLLCYMTKITIDIDYNSSTPDFQGETQEHTTIEMPKEIYDEIFFNNEAFIDDRKSIIKKLKEKEKQDKILEILKKASKEEYVFILSSYPLPDYPYSIEDGSDGYRRMELTKDEFDLLKQWLEEQV